MRASHGTGGANGRGLDAGFVGGKRGCARRLGRRWWLGEGVETRSATGQPARRQSGVSEGVTNNIQASSQCSDRPSSTVGRRCEGAEDKKWWTVSDSSWVLHAKQRWSWFRFLEAGAKRFYPYYSRMYGVQERPDSGL